MSSDPYDDASRVVTATVTDAGKKFAAALGNGWVRVSDEGDLSVPLAGRRPHPHGDRVGAVRNQAVLCPRRPPGAAFDSRGRIPLDRPDDADAR